MILRRFITFFVGFFATMGLLYACNPGAATPDSLHRRIPAPPVKVWGSDCVMVPGKACVL